MLFNRTAPFKIIVAIFIVAVAGYFVMRWLIAANSPTPADLGVQNGHLRPCPDSPNCVSSTSADPVQAIEPLPYTLPTAEMQGKLLAVLNGMQRATVVTHDPSYIHAELRTGLLGFVDDAEFYFDEANSVLHMRAGARLGYSDMGVNHRNLAQIRSALTK